MGALDGHIPAGAYPRGKFSGARTSERHHETPPEEQRRLDAIYKASADWERERKRKETEWLDALLKASDQKKGKL